MVVACFDRLPLLPSLYQYWHPPSPKFPLFILPCHLLDVSPLAGLASLSKVSLANTHVVDFSPLASWSLTELDLSNNGALDLSPYLPTLADVRLKFRYAARRVCGVCVWGGW